MRKIFIILLLCFIGVAATQARYRQRADNLTDAEAVIYMDNGSADNESVKITQECVSQNGDSDLRGIRQTVDSALSGTGLIFEPGVPNNLMPVEQNRSNKCVKKQNSNIITVIPYIEK
jgi:hypothetical protein